MKIILVFYTIFQFFLIFFISLGDDLSFCCIMLPMLSAWLINLRGGGYYATGGVHEINKLINELLFSPILSTLFIFSILRIFFSVISFYFLLFYDYFLLYITFLIIISILFALWRWIDKEQEKKIWRISFYWVNYKLTKFLPTSKR